MLPCPVSVANGLSTLYYQPQTDRHHFQTYPSRTSGGSRFSRQIDRTSNRGPKAPESSPSAGLRKPRSLAAEKAVSPAEAFAVAFPGKPPWHWHARHDGATLLPAAFRPTAQR